ncbi:MAG: TlyA family RNA methyltransferase [Clostridia bacterium]|nr:TlyA family RNA methyltransferase [Clostridia bacterium]
MIRVDLYLVQNGFVSGRDAAKRLIAEGGVKFDGRPVARPSEQVDETLPHDVTLPEAGQGYASRGGLKLEGALDASGLSPAGLVALDIGASGGGFTDCLLRRGAVSVYALDNGHGQLADFLRRDPRVTVMEGYNARDLKREDFPLSPRFVTMDVSFISQTLILPALAGMLDPGAILVSLIKPQFEVGRAGVGRGGIVKDPALRLAAKDKVISFAASLGFTLLGSCVSPIRGGDGNEEYLAWFSFDGNGKE